MYIWLIRRLLQATVVLLCMTIIVFWALHAIGNPIDILVSEDTNQIEKAKMIADLGLDKSIFQQYFYFISQALQGDLGRSYVYNTSAMSVIFQRLPATLELAVVSMLLAIIIGIPLGLICGLRPHTWYAKLLTGISIVSFSLPTFWVALMFILFFSVYLGWLPSTGRGETVQFLGISWSLFTLDGLRHLLLPALTLSLFKIALILRITRSGVFDVRPLEYIKFARAKGLKNRRIISVHILKNIMIPLVTIIGVELGSTIAFAVVTETIFSWPGSGKLIIDSINSLDRPVIVAYLMIIVCLFVLINLTVDILYRVLDPRTREESSS